MFNPRTVARIASIAAMLTLLAVAFSMFNDISNVERTLTLVVVFLSFDRVAKAAELYMLRITLVGTARNTTAVLNLFQMMVGESKDESK